MGCTYFDQQRTDVAGVLAVRLQKLILISFALSALYLGFFLWEGLNLHSLPLGPIAIILVSWLACYIGFKGARNRNPRMLFVYIVFSAVGSFILLLSFLFASVGGSVATVLLLDKCASDPKCEKHAEAQKDMENYPLIIAVIFVVSVILFVVPLFFSVLGMFLASLVRKHLLVLHSQDRQMSVMERQKLPQTEDVSSYAMKPISTPAPEVQMQSAPMPMFFHPQVQHQGYIPAPTHPSQQGMFMYVPYGQMPIQHNPTTQIQ